MLKLNIEDKIFKRLKELEEFHELRVVVDNKLYNARGYVVENCGQYLIVIKDGLSGSALKDVLLHEGVHICFNHLEGYDEEYAENEVESITEDIKNGLKRGAL